MTNNEVRELGLLDLSICEVHHVRHEYRCGGCSCELKRLPGVRGVRKCSRCGGLGGVVSLSGIVPFVRLDLDLSNEESTRYFDFQIPGGRRIHGWFNEKSKRVTQVG